jgi:hypothetical protein
MCVRVCARACVCMCVCVSFYAIITLKIIVGEGEYYAFVPEFEKQPPGAGTSPLVTHLYPDWQVHVPEEQVP